jgi:hypothetical protein
VQRILDINLTNLIHIEIQSTLNIYMPKQGQSTTYFYMYTILRYVYV